MLESLHIKNLALIDSIHIDFSPGFTILSGETGTGKSIILGALSLLFGDKVDASLIRSGTQEASVSAVISLSPASLVRSYVIQKGIEVEDDQLIITRNVKQTGRGTIYVQGQPMTRNDLSFITHLLFDIHGQSEHQSLLNSEKQRTILDSYSNSDPLITHYLIPFNELKEVEKEIIKVKKEILDASKEEDYLSFVVKEIESASPKKGEDEELLEEITMLTQYELLSDNLETSYHALKGNDENNGALLSLRSSFNAIKKISTVDSSLKEIESRLEPLILEVEDITLVVREKLSSMTFSQSRLDSLNERIALLQRIKKKYGPSLEDVLILLEKTKHTLSYTTNSEEIIEDLLDQKKKISFALHEKGAQLTEHRKKKADELSHLISLRLKELNMEDVSFIISVEEGEYTTSGKDTIEFMFSANLGEPVKKLSEIASGGELSRLMLAIKRVLGESDDIETFIFDEVDNGIGGAVAYSVGEQIAQIAIKHQVIVISHLASIASRADNHLVVKKISDGVRTYTTINKVEKEERVKEIARMLSGQEENTEALTHAATLLAQNEHYLRS